MNWRDTCAMDQRRTFVAEAQRDDSATAEVVRWLRRALGAAYPVLPVR